MKKYIEQYDNYIKEKMNNDVTLMEKNELLKYHKIQIEFVQHERLVHLIISIITGILFLLFSYLYLISNYSISSFILGVLTILMLIVLFFYIIHYCYLENKVQEWYKIYRDLNNKNIK